MYVGDGDVQSYLIEDIINRKNPSPSLNEILNVIETPEMELNLDKYDTFDTDTKEGIAKKIIDQIPEDGYTYDTFVKVFEALVTEKYNQLHHVSGSNKKDKKDKTDSSVVSTETITIIEETIAEGEIVEETTVTFSDMTGHWAREYAETLAARGLFEGVGNGMFDPNLGITRAEIATVLVKLAGYELTDFNSGFSDVDGENQFEKYIATARMHNIIAGVSATEFEPDRIVTRQEIATMIMKLYKRVNGETPSNSSVEEFNDSGKIYEYAYGHVMNAKKLGIVNGRMDNQYDPVAVTKRSEAAVMIYNLLDSLGEL